MESENAATLHYLSPIAVIRATEPRRTLSFRFSGEGADKDKLPAARIDVLPTNFVSEASRG